MDLGCDYDNALIYSSLLYHAILSLLEFLICNLFSIRLFESQIYHINMSCLFIYIIFT
jgi:hypothetical protein